jgi:MFS transporter, DHA3 family, tetracycline resistance protein
MPKADAYRLYLFYVGGTAFLYSMVFTVMLFYYAEGVGMNPLQLVLTGTALEIGILFFEVPTGVVADMYSRRLSIIIGVFIIGLGFLLTAIPNVALILFAQALWGFGFTFTSGATDAWITDEIGETAANQAFVSGTRVSLLGALLGVVPSVAAYSYPSWPRGYSFCCWA